MLTKCGIGSNTALGSGGRNRKREVREALGGGYGGPEIWKTRVSETVWLKYFPEA